MYVAILTVIHIIVFYILIYLIKKESKVRQKEVDNLRDRYYELKKEIVQIENELNSIKSLSLYLLKEKNNIIKIKNK